MIKTSGNSPFFNLVLWESFQDFVDQTNTKRILFKCNSFWFVCRRNKRTAFHTDRALKSIKEKPIHCYWWGLCNILCCFPQGIFNCDNLKGKTKDFIRSANVHETEFRKFDIHLGFIHIPGLDDQGKNNFSISRSMYKLDLRVSSCIISTEATQLHGPYISWFRIFFGQLKIFHQIFMFKYWKLLLFFV